MATSWQLLGKAIAQSADIPEARKPVSVAIAWGESGQGITWVAKNLLNFWSLKQRDGFGTEGVLAPDGYVYMKFISFAQAVRIFWKRIHLSPYYDGIDEHQKDDRDFLDFMGPHFCPPGYPGSPAHPKWYRDHGNRTYTEYILSFLDEAIAFLKSCGWADIPRPAPDLEPIATGGPMQLKVIQDNLGLRVDYALWRPVKNFDRIRIKPVRGMVHYTAALEGEDIERGTMAGWDNILTQASAHNYITRKNPRLFQCVPLQYRAWGAAQWNPTSWHVELENLGCFYDNEQRPTAWYDKKTHRFCRWFWPGIVRSAPIEEFVLLRHPKEYGFRWWHTYPEDQIALLVELLRAWKAYNPALRFDGHDMYEPSRLDPGPAFPWAQVRAALA